MTTPKWLLLTSPVDSYAMVKIVFAIYLKKAKMRQI